MNAHASLQVPTLTTQRLRLTPLTFAHSQGMFALWSSAAVCRYSGPAADIDDVPIPLPARTAADSDRIIAFFAALQARGEAFRWAAVCLATDEFVGALGFNALGECAELAYHQLPSHWGKGYMSEACAAAIEWARTQTCARTIDAYVERENATSIALAKRLGFAALHETKAGAERYQMRFD